MSILMCFSNQHGQTGTRAWAVPLGLTDGQALHGGGGWQRQLALLAACSAGRRRRLVLSAVLGRSGVSMRGGCALMQAILAGGGRGRLGLVQMVCTGAAGRVALPGSLAATPQRSLALASAAPARIRGRLDCPAAFLPPAVTAGPRRRLLLAGADITHGVQACTLRQGQDDPHLRLTLAGVDASLADGLDRAREAATPVLVLEIQERCWRFVVTNLAVEDRLLTVRAAGTSILRDAPHAGLATVGAEVAARLGLADGVSTGCCSAREMTAAVLAPAPLTWDMEDFPLPPGVALQDAPVALAVRMVAAGGGVLRATADGGFRARPRYPYGPAVLPTAREALQARAEESLLGLTVTEDPGLPWGAVHVLGAAGEAAAPQLMVEHVGRQEAVVRAYWRHTGPEVLRLAPWISAGRVQRLGSGLETIAERVIFVGGQATASRPVLRLLEPVAWAGHHGGAVQAARRSESLQADAGVHGLADIRYRTAFDRFLLRDVAQPEALFVLGVAPASAVAVTVRSSLRPDAILHPVHPEVLEEPLAGSRRAAVLAGEALLLGTCLPRRLVTAQLPFQAAVKDGAVFRVQSAEAGMDARFFLTGWSLHCEGPSCIHTLEGVSWR